MFCNRCGTKLPDDAQFCHKCGYKMSNIISNNQPIETPSTSAYGSSVSILKKIIIIIGEFLISIFLIAIIFIAFGNIKNLANFIMDYRGLAGYIAQGIGGAIGVIVFYVPLTKSLKRLKVIKKSYLYEIYLFWMIFYSVFGVMIGTELHANIMPPIHFIALLIGIVLWVYIKIKKL